MVFFRLYTVLPRLMKFIDNLTNWYVRTNRKRLKGEGNSREDCQSALETLFSVLFVMIRVFAPFTPFLTEHMYQTLRRLAGNLSDQKDTASVHFLMIPAPREDLIDVDIERSVARMQTVIELGRVVRDRRTMPIKYPLPELVVIHKDTQCLDDVRTLMGYIVEELNVKKVTLSTDKKQYGVSFRAEPDHKTLGLRLKGAFKDVAKEIKAMTDAQVADFIEKGSVCLLGHELGPDDVRVMYSFGGGSLSSKYEAHSDNDLLVVLDCTPDQSMLDEGTSREVMNRVQKLRKKAGLVPSDQVTVHYSLEGKGSADLERVINEFRDAIESTTKSPIRPLSAKNAGQAKVVEETFSLKEMKLKLEIVQGFCSDFTGGTDLNSNGTASEVATHGSPNCSYVNMAFEDRIGVVLLENPSGCNALKTVDDLRKQVAVVFGLEEGALRLFEDKDCRTPLRNVSSAGGKTLFAKTSGGMAPNAQVSGKGSSCRFIHLKLKDGKDGVFLLENPAGSPLEEHAEAFVTSLASSSQLYEDKNRKKKVSWTTLQKYMGKTLYL